MTPTLRSLAALKAIATWEMGEAALALSSALAAHDEVQARASAIQRQSEAIAIAYGRAAQPGQRLQLAAVNQLSRQASASLEVRREVDVELGQADERVRQERETLSRQRAREDALQKVIRRERQREQAERAKVECANLDDLVLARRWVRGDGVGDLS